MSIKLNHITKADRQNVYPPSEDTFLMIDALTADADTISSINPSIIAEVGIGSGAVLGTLALLPSLNCAFFGFDLSKSATSLSQSTFSHNNLNNIELISTNIFYNLNILNKIDVLVCNPPYVPTSSEEYFECQRKKNIDSSCAGGVNGKEFIQQFLEFAEKALSDTGILYLLVDELNGEFKGTIIKQRRRGGENLAVVRMSKSEVRVNI